MNNKKTLYILLPVVLFIWGVVLYQLFSFGNNDEINDVPLAAQDIKPVNFKQRDSFLINVNYRDPFLGKAYLPAGPVIKKNSVKKNNIQKEVVVWPALVYKGTVSDNKEKKKVFMVIINGQTFLMVERQTELEVTLVKGNRDLIEVKYHNNTNKVLIQQ